MKKIAAKRNYIIFKRASVYLGDFSDLDKTNISKDEAFSAGCIVCGKNSSCEHNSSYMAKPQLHKIYEYAKKTHDMIEDGEQLPDWIESNIAKIDHMIGSIYHKLNYRKKDD